MHQSIHGTFTTSYYCMSACSIAVFIDAHERNHIDIYRFNMAYLLVILVLFEDETYLLVYSFVKMRSS